MILAIELAREGANLAISDANGAPQHALSRDWRPQTPPATQWLLAMEACRDLFFRAALETAEIERVGLAFDGLIRNGIAGNDPTRPGWNGYDFARAVREHLGIARAAAASRFTCQALGEARFGALRGHANWIYAHLGDEFGGALCFAGQILSGGDVGGLVLERDGALDGFGKRGTLRAYCGGAALESRARSYGMSGQSAGEIWALAESNFAAHQLCDDFTSRLAQGLSSALALLDAPICIGGAVGAAIWPQLAAPLASKMREMAPDSPPILRGALGEDAATLGALALALI